MQTVPFQVGLHLVTLVMCILTLTMATAALMPQIKAGIVLLRDGLLWAILIGILSFIGFVGWVRLHESRQRTADDPSILEPVSQSPLQLASPPEVRAPMPKVIPSAPRELPPREMLVERRVVTGDLVVDSSIGIRELEAQTQTRNAAAVWQSGEFASERHLVPVRVPKRRLVPVVPRYSRQNGRPERQP